MAGHPTLLITHRSPRHQQNLLAAAPPGFEFTVLRTPSKEELLAELAEVEFLVSERSGVIDADMINTGKKLRLIQRLGSQAYDIDLEAARVAGVPVCYAPVYSCIMVAEHMVLQMLSLAKRLREVMHVAAEAGDWGKKPQKTDENYFVYNWSGRQGICSLWEATVGILGFGEIGIELARRLQPFGCTMLYNKRTRLLEAAEEAWQVSFAPLDEMLGLSDYLCVLLPYFPETEQMIDADFLSRMKPGACIVSCGSGGLLDEAAVAEALRAGHLSGAATDTYTYEPIPADNPLLPLARQPGANIVLTPHTAAGTPTDPRAERARDYANLVRVLQGEPLLYRLV